ncbi:MAG: malate:quinone oxidoreductase [Candidatus Micrarchaeota archaeon]|nr:MAG: malate:quinone oxidoreductase [Candidatus Micrarchaeota archaeon]
MEIYDVAIVGGGVIGTALFYLLSNYTNIKSEILIEKNSDFGMVNTHEWNNAQTLHFGDIETNYTVEKAKETKVSSEMLEGFLLNTKGLSRDIFKRCNKMVLAVGDSEVEALREKYELLKPVFSYIRYTDNRDIIKRFEPYVVKGRDRSESIAIIQSDNGYMVNFRLLSKDFIRLSRKDKNKKVLLNTKVKDIRYYDGLYRIYTDKAVYSAKIAVLSAGSYSFYFAKRLGYADNLIILPVGGNFYRTTKRFTNGKIYRVERTGIPFAAVHADPEIDMPNTTRFGPTATFSPVLEVRYIRSFLDYLMTLDFNLDTIKSIINILRDKDIIEKLSSSMSYNMPIIGKKAFVDNEARKIIPSLRYDEIYLAKGVGGIRPQIVDEKEHKIKLGTGKIVGEQIIFNITPSPGASACLKIGLSDAYYISKALDLNIELEKLFKDLGKESIMKDILDRISKESFYNNFM